VDGDDPELREQVGLTPLDTDPAKAIGWYLKEPYFSSLNGPPLLGSPLSDWPQSDAFDTAKECKAARDGKLQKAYAHQQDELRDEQTSHKSAKQINQDRMQEQYSVMAEQSSMCVASNDLRLKR
jgi:hypothetical protein